MRLIFVILICFSGTVLSRYYEKRRFDRSIRAGFESSTLNEPTVKKQWIFSDYETRFRAYRDRNENNCYLKKLESNVVEDKYSKIKHQQRIQISKTFYAFNEVLTKLEAWRIAGGRIVDFCQGRKIILLQNTVAIPEQSIDPFFNILPYDENDIATRRVADIVLTPLINRAKRQIALERRQELNKYFSQRRSRRQTPQSRGKFRGQTQSQYLNIDNNDNDRKEGKAEAEATQQSSRSIVSGSRGMGQAQSMSFGSIGCEDCNKYTSENGPDRYIQYPSSGTNYARTSLPRLGDSVTYPESVLGTTVTRNGIYPGSVPSTATSGSGVIYPGSMPITSVSRGSGVYPGNVPTTITREGSVVYTGGVPHSRGTESGTAAYSANIPGAANTGTEITHSGHIPSTLTIGNGLTYSGNIPNTETPLTEVSHPGGAPNTPTITTRGGIAYPNTAPSATVDGGTSYSGSISDTTSSSGIAYPENVPGTTIGSIGHSRSIPKAISNGGLSYPGNIPIATSSHGMTYRGSLPDTTTTGDSVTYSERVPGTTTGGVITYPGIMPSITHVGNKGPYVERIDGNSAVYPGSVPGTKTESSVVYPSSVPSAIGSGGIYASTMPGITINSDGGVYSGNRGNRLTTEKLATYPSSMVPNIKKTIHGQIDQTESKAIANAATYHNGQMSGIKFPSERDYLTIREGNINGDKIIYPEMPTSILPGNIAEGPTIMGYRDSASPPPDQLKETMYYPNKIVPESQISNIASKGSGTYFRSAIPTNIGTENLYPNALPGTTSSHIGNHAIISPGYSQAQYSGYLQPEQYPNYPQQSQYPNAVRWQNGEKPIIKQYRNEGQSIKQQYPESQYSNVGEISQYYQQPNTSPSMEDDNSNSQASSTVKQTNSGTQASASAHGKYRQGTAQSQVTGTYSGSGSFSAQAGSTDINKSAQTEINGGKEGATSHAQGTGGYGKSQAQVQLDSEAGATSTGAQSSGWNHGTNSQVQASSKGGMADAQANGEGSTSSQAQIGFQPYLKTDEEFERHSKPFRGGGTASAQSGTHRGQSQSQLEGSFQYGITYTGAAQAGSGSGAVASRKPFNFNLTDNELFKPSYIPQIVKSNNSEAANTSSDIDYEYNQDKVEQGLQTSSSSQKAIIIKPVNEKSKNVVNKRTQFVQKSQTDDSAYDYEEEYDGEDDGVGQQNDSIHQSQALHLATGNQYNLHVKQDTNTAHSGDILQPEQTLAGYTIPPGFRGKVTSIAGSETIAHGDGISQSQSTSLVPIEPHITHENKSPISDTRSLKTNHERLTEDHILSNEKHKVNFSQIQNRQPNTQYSTPTTNIPMKPSYYTVTNSIAGKMDDSRNSARKYEHRYYTKSSTCGYFTFSCNIVYGSNGRTKICKPKMPTYPDGTPMKC